MKRMKTMRDETTEHEVMNGATTTPALTASAPPAPAPKRSDGFDDDAWVTQIARPCIDELGNEVLWPVAIASLSGTQMLVRETTDHRSPLAVERISPGMRLPLLSTA